MIRFNGDVDDLIEKAVADRATHPHGATTFSNDEPYNGVGKSCRGGGNTSRTEASGELRRQ